MTQPASDSLTLAFRERVALVERVPRWNVHSTVRGLRDARDRTSIRHRGRIHEMPTRSGMADVIDGLRAVLFPTHYGRTDLSEETVDFFVGSTLHKTMTLLFEQIRRALFFASSQDDLHDDELRRRAVQLTEELAASLPELRVVLVADLHAEHEAEDGHASLAEILVCSHRMRAVFCLRVAQRLEEAGLRFLARLVAEVARAETGIEIRPDARRALGTGEPADDPTG
jgi:serine O-acetyltransferase